MGAGARLVESGAAVVSDTRAQRNRMSTDRWRRVQDLFAAALECDAADRPGLVGDACGDDEEMRREVESRLASHDNPGPLDRLASAVAPAAAWARTQVAGWEGRRVGQYLVLELVDAGGMGIVYKAHDERLGRRVALKFLPPHLSTEPAPKQRFLTEARAAAALDHPNICTIFEIGETDEGQLFLAMPLYDGETVAARLKRGRLPFEDAVPIAVQIARGAGAAHARGVVHRDLASRRPGGNRESAAESARQVTGEPLSLDRGLRGRSDGSCAGWRIATARLGSDHRAPSCGGARHDRLELRQPGGTHETGRRA